MNTLLALPAGKLLPVALAAIFLVGAGLSPAAVSADSSNTKTVEQNEHEEQGSETGSGTSGTTNTTTRANVKQRNVQVFKGDEDALANSSQDATNDATVTQTASATSGDATALDGGKARSGNASAGTFANVVQLNVQVMILLSPECEAHQSASNTANIDQTAEATSGDATAVGPGSEAASGDASSVTRSNSMQRNTQVYVCTPRGDSPTYQEASNTYDARQTAKATSGGTFAGPGSSATSGDATSEIESKMKQSNRQIRVR